MAKLNAIGLDAKKAAHLVDELNVLLGNYSIFYQNVRGFHWNIRGEKFFELHVKFEELYGNLQLKIDEIAERILTLGGIPTHSFATFFQESTIKPLENVKDGRKAVQAILSAFNVLLLLERDILALAVDAADEGTNALMSDYIREKEKLVWMYSAYLG